MAYYWILFIGLALISWMVQANLKRKFNTYSKIANPTGMSGAEVALKMLRDKGLDNVSVTHTPGRLTDHYNPNDHTVNLSEEVYHGRSVMAAAVAAHECGHAVQHAKLYAPLRMRSALVPIVSFSSSIVMWVLLAGMLVINRFPQLMLSGIMHFALTTLFSFITLPVEIDASKRALKWFSASGAIRGQQYGYATSALKAAAYTYVVAALGSLATLLYYIMIFMGRRD